VAAFLQPSRASSWVFPPCLRAWARTGSRFKNVLIMLVVLAAVRWQCRACSRLDDHIRPPRGFLNVTLMQFGVIRRTAADHVTPKSAVVGRHHLPSILALHGCWTLQKRDRRHPTAMSRRPPSVSARGPMTMFRRVLLAAGRCRASLPATILTFILGMKRLRKHPSCSAGPKFKMMGASDLRAVFSSTTGRSGLPFAFVSDDRDAGVDGDGKYF